MFFFFRILMKLAEGSVAGSFSRTSRYDGKWFRRTKLWSRGNNHRSRLQMELSLSYSWILRFLRGTNNDRPTRLRSCLKFSRDQRKERKKMFLSASLSGTASLNSERASSSRVSNSTSLLCKVRTNRWRKWRASWWKWCVRRCQKVVEGPKRRK